jgi:hypothetical protein
MKIANTRSIKVIIIIIAAIVALVLVVILLISPIAKYMIEKYDVKYTGRQISMGWVYINPFTGYIHISNLKIYEFNPLHELKGGDSIFFSAKGVSANFAMLKLLSNTIEISSITLDHPKGIVIQKEKELNFTDLIKLFTPKKPRTTPASVHFSILKIKIENGVFCYREEVTAINYFIKAVNIESTGKRWNADTMAVTFSLMAGIGSGDMKGGFTINFKTNDYRIAIVTHKFDLNIIEQYLKDLTNYGTFSANIDADVKAKGNFHDVENITVSGQLAINEFHFGKNPEDDYASFDKLVLAIIEVSPKNYKYLFDSVSLTHPYLKYEHYDYLDNLQMMFGKDGANIAAARSDPAKFNLIIEVARYIKVLVRNFFQSYYKIDRLAIYNGNLKFNDFAISEKFSVNLNPLYIIADSIDKNHDRVKVSLKSGIKPYGNANVALSINPKDSTDFDLQYHIQRVPVSMFNPYLITYTSFPLDRGTIEINGLWKVRNGFIQSHNHLLVIDPRRSNRVRNKDKKWLPLPLVMSLVRERGNVIDYEIPITGNLKDPKFHLKDVIVDLIENVFVKPATTAYRLEVKNTETEIERSLTLKWQMRQSSLLSAQEEFINKMVDFLIKNPDASIAVYPIEYAEKEKEYIGFFEAKKKYFLRSEDKNANFPGEDDSLEVDKMSVKDSLFVHYLNKHNNDTLLFTIQDKCSVFIGSARINNRFNELNSARENAFMLPFRKKAVENRVKIQAGETTIPYNGFSFYKITYKGEVPESLIKAYRKMNELNDESPRKKYKKDRKKSITGL